MAMSEFLAGNSCESYRFNDYRCNK